MDSLTERPCLSRQPDGVMSGFMFGPQRRPLDCTRNFGWFPNKKGPLDNGIQGPIGGGEGTDVPGFSHTFAFSAHHSRYRDQKLVFRPCFSLRCSE